MHALFTLSKSAAGAGLDVSEWVILICGLVLVLGIFGEYKKVPKWMARWPESVFAVLVMVGVAGELFGDGGVFLCSRRLQILEGADIQTLSRTVDTALDNANRANSKARLASDTSTDAKEEADRAKLSSGTAESLARGARHEADSFEKDIVSAKESAATAESHLAGALQQAADAKAELNRLESPRVLNNIPTLVSELSQLKGTEYTYSGVSPDDESYGLLRSVDSVLQQAGWKRGKATGGFPALNFSFDAAGSYSIPEAVTDGLRISVDWPGGFSDDLRSLPLDKLPIPIKAAVFLNLVLYSSLSPSEERPKVEIDNGISKMVRISVGKKP